ncbi:hypothetical protein BCR33DRAFT_337975 [Rhizoclosmatium globosum]|uniref:Dynein assembly factor 3 C-terminal domain-containing protein n=1 Tax=Rhizoclosmatium globosum TaxID=329046 RepID=A0A1Y2C419_9FUNG|nr:hypothetical protein BCR33DRAFT_337975 [Rhizoclosmatium globosum]|eukprot:ORY41696.1 hypothetical protein BCR33DRAFT_337975 [Rhizoclosmatium globosum]
MKQDGLSVTKWGYFNDVLTGPFVPYGIETEKKELTEKSMISTNMPVASLQNTIFSLIWRSTRRLFHPQLPSHPASRSTFFQQ